MAADRTDELRRRVQRDPASIVFGQLAEEYRRAGQFEKAVRVARGGLERRPTFLSARVTLARALADLGRHDEARREFQYVLAVAPDNLAAIRGLAALHQRAGEELAPGASGPPPAPPGPEAPGPGAAASAGSGMGSFDWPPAVPAEDFDPGKAAAGEEGGAGEFGPGEPGQQVAEPDPALESLERWLAAIEADRLARHASGR